MARRCILHCRLLIAAKPRACHLHRFFCDQKFVPEDRVHKADEGLAFFNRSIGFDDNLVDDAIERSRNNQRVLGHDFNRRQRRQRYGHGACTNGGAKKEQYQPAPLSGADLDAFLLGQSKPGMLKGTGQTQDGRLLGFVPRLLPCEKATGENLPVAGLERRPEDILKGIELSVAIVFVPERRESNHARIGQAAVIRKPRCELLCPLHKRSCGIDGRDIGNGDDLGFAGLKTDQENLPASADFPAVVDDEIGEFLFGGGVPGALLYIE